jgi:hypothetical protein
MQREQHRAAQQEVRERLAQKKPPDPTHHRIAATS